MAPRWNRRRSCPTKMAKLWLMLGIFIVFTVPSCSSSSSGSSSSGSSSSSSSNSNSNQQSEGVFYVTFPSSDDEEYALGTTEPPEWHDAEDYNDQSFISVSSVPVRSAALLRLPAKDARVIFMADDFEAAARIPELRTTVPERPKSMDDNPLFPKTRSGPPATSTTERIFRDVASSSNDNVRGNYRTESYPEDALEDTDSRMTNAGQDQEIDSRHSSRGGHYRPNNYYQQLPPRQPPPRPRPSPNRHSQGSSVIDKEDIFHNNIYSGRPGSSIKRPHMRNMTRVTHIEAECQDDFMRIHVQFNGTFNGLIYSSGYAYDSDCIYVNGSGRSIYDFFIRLNRCGTLSGNEKGREDVRGRTPTKNMMWNTLTVQYNALIEEEWDEHFKVTCEYGYDFWKTVTFPFLDVEVQTGNPVVFTLTPPECHMEIRYGYGTAGTRVSGPVRVGDPLTLVIYMRSDFEGFDIVVSDCYAHNGGNKKITLIDHYGCPVDEKLISHFEGTWTSEGIYETQVYAFMKTFRFTGSPALYIECDVRMCHGDCPTQPCHWRRGKKEKRSVNREGNDDNSMQIPPANVSESLSLFQSIQVVRDDYLSTSTKKDPKNKDVCLKTGTVSALSGMVAIVLGLLTAVCGVMCMRLRRMKKQEEAHHPGSSIRPTSMPYVPHYKSDFVPPVKRRLE